jgi:lysozyme
VSAVRPIVLAGALLAAAGTAAFIGPWEGRRLTAYRDVVNVWTVCEGVTGPAAQPGRTYTEAECDALTTDAVAKHLRGIATCIHVPLKENEWVAVGSWAYNVGVSAACGSTLVRKINAGDGPYKWCQQLLRWDRAGGKKVRGLTRRRQAEYKVCIGADR